jgi:hypothetical protein
VKAKNIIINGTYLNVILRHYNSIQYLIEEVKRLGGSFEQWDKYRSNKEDIDVEIELRERIK